MNIKEIQGTLVSGKKILIIAGIHGNEYSPILVAKKLLELPKNSFQRLTIINAANTSGLQNNFRDTVSQYTTDLNRSLYTNPDVDINTLKKYILDCDVLIDIHSSPNCTEFILVNQDETANGYINFVKKLNINYCLRFSDTNTIKKFGIENNKISFTLEINGLSKIDFQSVERGFNVVNKIIKNISKLVLVKEEPTYKEYFEYFTYKSGIVIKENFLKGQIINSGDSVCTMMDLNTLEEFEIIYNKEKAMIIASDLHPYISPSKSIFSAQPIN